MLITMEKKYFDDFIEKQLKIRPKTPKIWKI